MTAAQTGGQTAVVRKREIMLQVNQKLFETGAISRTVYEQAKVKIVSGA